MGKQKIFAFSFAVLAMYAFKASALEVDFGFGDMPATLPEYLSVVFSWLLGIAGIVSLISFTIGAVQLISPSVEMHSEAKDRMKGAAIGLVLTIGSVAIINTINPNLAQFQLDDLPNLDPLEKRDVPGAYFYSDGGCLENVIGPATSPTQISFAEGKKLGCVKVVNDPAKKIFYGVILRKNKDFKVGAECTEPMIASQNSPEQKFPVVAGNGNDAGFVAANVFQINPSPVTSGTGITFFGKTFAKARVTGLYYISPDEIPSTGLKKDLKAKPSPMCFNFANNSQDTWTFKHKCVDSSCNYANLFCKTNDDCGGATVCDAEFRCWAGPCKTDSDCSPDPKLGEKCNTELGICMGTPCSVGSGGIVAGCRTGQKCENKGTCIGSAERNLPLGERQIYCSSNACETFRDCPQSIRIAGSYVVGLYSSANATQTAPFCQTYQTSASVDITNLNTQGSDFGAGWVKIDYVYMFPIK